MRRRARLQLDDFLPYLINRVGAALVARFTELALARHQLSIDMWRVLAALSDNGGRQVDLAGMTSIDASTISRMVTRLVHKGLVKRSRSRTNGREVVVELTVRGKALVDQLIPVALSVESLAVSAMRARDLVRIKWLLRRMYDRCCRCSRQELARGGKSLQRNNFGSYPGAQETCRERRCNARP